METKLLGDYFYLVPHPDDSKEHKEKLKHLLQLLEEENDI